MPRQTLTNYIKQTNDEILDKIFHFVVAEMNRRKAKEQNIDVGFWDSDGNYTEDIQSIDNNELAEILKEENETGEIKMESKQESVNYTKYAILEHENQRLSSKLSQIKEMWINSESNCTIWSSKYNDIKKDLNKIAIYSFILGFSISIIIFACITTIRG